MGKLAGKVAVITGGSSGIGLATARQFVNEGAHVFITGRRQSELDSAVARIGKCVTAVAGDVTSLADLDRLYETVQREKGRIDVLFANAGISSPRAPLGEIREQDFDQIFNINVRALLFTVQKALPLFADGGSILLNASIVASKGLPTTSVYSASKAAVRSFARTWTMDLKARKIRVNAISPGPTDTPLLSPAGQSEEQTRQRKAMFAASVPLGRLGLADEIAQAAVFLASDDSSFISGSELFVDGGMAQV
ncbi:MAG TPA: glucose 1-dehydrogenase [Bryobacteraceae bacterium]|nr:glucose 1-dehydrogenase [Bryobacteraceae bacterium]